MVIRQFSDDDALPWTLLLQADPSKAQILAYWNPAQALLQLVDHQVVGVLAWTKRSAHIGEICNISVHPDFQGRGFGKQLLQAVESCPAWSGMQEWQIATANSSISQLAFYQRAGYEIYEVVWNYFLDHYPSPIWENGIQAKHQIRLRKFR